MKLVEVIRKTQREYRTSMNKIEAVVLVRKLTGRGLKEAKDFFDWIHANGDGLSAPQLAGHWCEEHWQDNENCGCPKGVESSPTSKSKLLRQARVRPVESLFHRTAVPWVQRFRLQSRCCRNPILRPAVCPRWRR
jgi:hypothetical protein